MVDAGDLQTISVFFHFSIDGEAVIHICRRCDVGVNKLNKHENMSVHKENNILKVQFVS